MAKKKVVTVRADSQEDAPTLPSPVDRSYTPFRLKDAGRWLILSDLHLPYHDPRTIERAVAEGVKLGVTGVLLNGDILDSHELSTFDRDPTAPRYAEELDAAKGFLRWLRHKLPKARIVWKDGNHEERLQRYLMRHAPALFGLDLVSLPMLLDMACERVEYVTDKRVITLGRLNVIHGHEYRPGVSTPVNPARGVFLRTKAVALCGHFHQSSEHYEPTIAGKSLGVWSVGCCCQLSPAYSPLNRWNHGFAVVEVERDGSFHVRNHRVIDGQIA